ncbi:MAG: hypothetical protein NC247_02235 [Ruminococcus flavefaciens]|nr:hypothetical protein [Ruminococcus flavefaciens]
MGLTVAELVNFCNDNNIPLNTPVLTMGAVVKFVGYDKTIGVVSLDEEIQGDYDVAYEV